MLFTIGHSNHGFEDFFGLLRRHDIEAVADVRSRPYSRFVPHFSKDRLARRLGQEGLGYLFLGAELGGKPRGGEEAASAMTYQSRVRQPAFATGIDRLLAAARTQRVALMCRERDPLDCHRLHLICRHLAPSDPDIRHILPDGAHEMQAATERRLLARAGPEDLPLFQDLAQTAERRALERAYDSWWQASAP
ncbi:MAG: DUF488 family protein [Geminicoccaceae bacterium]